MSNTGRKSSRDVVQTLADSVARLNEQMAAMEARTLPARRGLEVDAYHPPRGLPFIPNHFREFQDRRRDQRRAYYDEEDYEDAWEAAPN